MFDAFLKLDAIPGESTDAAHKDWIEIESFSWGASQPAAGAPSATGDRSAGRVDISDFMVVKHLDKASPKLFLACAKGTHIKEVTLELCRAGGDKQKYLSYKLTDVLVSNVRPGGNASGSEGLPLEEVAFNFTKIEMGYIPIGKDGKPQGNVPAWWDLSKNIGG